MTGTMTGPMTGVLAAVEPTEWGVALAAVVCGALGIWTGITVWQGRYPGLGGPRPAYQTYPGGGHAAAPIGVGFALLGGGELVRGALGLSRHGAFLWVVSVVAAALLAASFLYVLAYFWTGVPGRLLPPYQRAERQARSAAGRRRLAQGDRR